MSISKSIDKLLHSNLCSSKIINKGQERLNHTCFNKELRIIEVKRMPKPVWSMVLINNRFTYCKGETPLFSLVYCQAGLPMLGFLTQYSLCKFGDKIQSKEIIKQIAGKATTCWTSLFLFFAWLRKSDASILFSLTDVFNKMIIACFLLLLWFLYE